jgi:TolB-like protein/DNA-binding winged helix-turn-helix (wHTH) protein
MEPSTGTPRPLRFATFELDVRSRELRQGERRIPLQEQPFQVLRTMLERPGEIVTREELQRRLWPDGTFVDFEHGLNAAVKRLRAVLGDTADSPRFVETLPRRGYRFIAKLNGGSGPQVRLVVLPFANLSGDTAEDYFSDSLTEELIAQLGVACRGRVGVIARWSSMTFKGASRRARDIAEALQASHLLEGTVRCDGERLRITARLIEAANETRLWSELYDRDLSQSGGLTSGRWSLAVQTDVASRVAGALAFELMPSPSATPSL